MRSHESYFTYDYFFQNFNSLEDFELLKIIQLRNDYKSIAVNAAKDIALKRGLIDKEFKLLINDQDLLTQLNSIETADQNENENQNNATKKPFSLILTIFLLFITIWSIFNTLVNREPIVLIKNVIVLTDPMEISESSEANSYYTCKIYFAGIEKLYKIDQTCYEFLNKKRFYSEIKSGRLVDLYVRNGIVYKLIFKGHDYCEYEESIKKNISNNSRVLLTFYILGGLLILGTLYENVRSFKILTLKYIAIILPQKIN